MDLNSLMESATALWATVGIAGGVTLINILTFIKTSVSGKKFNKLSDFAVVADQSIKFAKGEVRDLKNELVEETRKTIVEPLKEQVSALVSDNAQLSSVVVSLLSYIPLPLEVKKDAVAVIGTLGNITDEAKKLLESSIVYQEKQVVVDEKQNTDLQDNIDKI
jgi:hypothetical protein